MLFQSMDCRVKSIMLTSWVAAQDLCLVFGPGLHFAIVWEGLSVCWPQGRGGGRAGHPRAAAGHRQLQRAALLVHPASLLLVSR